MAVQHGLCACKAACCDLAQVVAACLNLMDSHVQQHVVLSVLCSVDGSAGLPVCMQSIQISIEQAGNQSHLCIKVLAEFPEKKQITCSQMPHTKLVTVSFFYNMS